MDTAGLRVTSVRYLTGLYLCYVSITVTVKNTEGSYEVLCDVISIISAGILAQSLDAAHPLQEFCFINQATTCDRKVA
jgi:hypothetical protein